MSTRRVAILVAALVVLSGCALPFGDGQTDATPGTPTTTPGAEETPGPSPTPNDTSPYPPGVSETSLENRSMLLSAHERMLNRTGYVAVGTGNTTISRSGFLVNVTRGVRIVVAAGSQRYHEIRRTDAGPVNRVVRRFSNGTVELRRHQQDGEVEYRRREPQSSEKLANVETLRSFFEAGNFAVTAVREEEGEIPLVLLRSNETTNESALRGVLPESAGEIRSYNASAVVDADGRVRALDATIEFTVGGQVRPHVVSFEIERVGVENVSRPDWVEEVPGESGGDGVDGEDADGSSDEAGENDARSSPDRRPAHWSRLVVSTSGWRA